MARHRQKRGRPPGWTAAERQRWLCGDYPEAVKSRIFLASRQALRGRRACLVCGKAGYGTRVSIPSTALRVDQPSPDGIEAYWLCQAHCAQPPADDEVPGLLAARRRSPRG